MSKKKYVVDMIAGMLNSNPTTVLQEAEMIVERLQDEGLLVLGYGDADIDRVVAKFSDTFGTTKTTKYDRFAAARLIKKYDVNAVIGIMDLLAKNSQEKYAPVVGSISQLEDKWVSVLSFLRNVKGSETIDV